MGSYYSFSAPFSIFNSSPPDAWKKYQLISQPVRQGAITGKHVARSTVAESCVGSSKAAQVAFSHSKPGQNHSLICREHFGTDFPKNKTTIIAKYFKKAYQYLRCRTCSTDKNGDRKLAVAADVAMCPSNDTDNVVYVLKIVDVRVKYLLKITTVCDFVIIT